MKGKKQDMANCCSITIQFENAESAGAALAVTESMIKLQYVPDGTPWKAEAEEIPSLSNRYFRFGSEAVKLDPLPEHPNCALKWLRQEQSQVVAERCADVQSPVDIFGPGDFFTQLCLTLSKLLHGTSFTAVCRHEETVSATVQLNRIVSDRGRMTYEERWILDEEEDPDEEDWSLAGKMTLQETDGVIPLPPRNKR